MGPRVDEYPTLVSLLDQDEVWGRPGDRVRLVDLEPEHLDNIAAYLIGIGPSLKFDAEWSLVIGLQPRGDMACDAFHDGMTELLEQSPSDWLEQTPLMLRLRELQATRETDTRP